MKKPLLKSCPFCDKQITEDSTKCKYCKKTVTNDHIYFNGIIKYDPEKKYNYARQDKRLFNYIIDNTVINIFVFSLFSFVNIREIDIGLIFYLYYYPTYLLYYILFEGITGRTIGKFITGTKVLSLKKENPLIVRSLARLIPFNDLSFLFSDGRKGWHDRISNTIVVEVD